MIVIPLSKLDLMTVAEVAEARRRSVQTVWRWVAQGRLPVVALGTPVLPRYLVRRQDCDALATPRRGRPPGPRTANPRATAPVTVSLCALGLMTLEEVAAHHRVKRNSPLYWVRKELLPVVLVGERHRTYLFRRADCERFRRPKPGPRGPRSGVRKGRPG